MKTHSQITRCSRLLASAGRLCAAPLALALAATGVSAQCDPATLFAPGVAYTVDSSPMALALGDIDGDGHADIVTANFFGNTITILQGNGDGTFGTRTDISMINPDFPDEIVGPVRPTIGDLNGDGHNDIVVALNNELAVLINNGDGTFQQQVYYGFGSQLRAVVIADMNNDGIPDVFYSSREDHALNILLGVGDGTFLPDVFNAFPLGPVGGVVHDFNNDGNLDIAAPLVFSNEIVIAHGNGTGVLSESARYAATGPEWLDLGDFTGNGVADLVTANTNGSAVQYFIGNGDGTFQAAQSIAVGDILLGVGAADVNGDGFDDIVAVRAIESDIRVFLSNGDGTFQAGVDFEGQSAFLGRAIAFADLTGNGALDAVTANSSSSVVNVYLNQCGGGTAVCLGDIADDFGLTADEGGGPDGVVDFGDFAALLGLIGPCDGGVPGCLGDIADDFGLIASEGGGPDGVVDFGDFAALLGLIGPCPE